MFKRILLPILILAVAGIGFYALNTSKPEQTKIVKPEKAWLVHTVPVIFQSISPQLTLYGRLETPHKATLKSALVADVTNTTVLEGTEVNTGQLLVNLDDTDLQITLEQRKADLAEIEASINSEMMRYNRDKGLLKNEKKLLALTENAVVRAQKLEKNKLASQANLDDALAAKQQQILTIERMQYDISEHPVRLKALKAKQAKAKALVEQIKVDLARTKIKAPFSGRIAKLYVAPGDRVRIGDEILSLYDLSGLEVRAQIPGRYFETVRKQLEQGNHPSASAKLNGSKVHFKLVRLSGEIRQDSGGVDGLFKLSDKVSSVPLGTFVELNLKLSKQNKVIAIPFDALYELDRVYRIKNGYMEAVKIERVGEIQTNSGEKKLLIRSDKLMSSDLLISTQLPNAITGLRVEVAKDPMSE